MNHNVLSKPTVKEVSFDIRFEPSKAVDFEEVSYAFISKFSTTYPKRISTDIDDKIPKNFPIKGLIRKQLVSENEMELIGLGKDIVSVHSLQHKHFSDFSKKIESLISVLQEISKEITIERLGLRYINEIDIYKRTIKEILSKDLSFVLGKFKAIGMNAIYQYNKGKNQLNIRVLQKPKETKLYLDLDIFTTEIHGFEEILAWSDVAHNEIYNAFVLALNNNFFNEIST